MTNPPAFPLPESTLRNYGANSGMSLLDYFAAKAMQGIIASGAETDKFGYDAMEQVARVSYTQAEAMLAEREKRLKQPLTIIQSDKAAVLLSELISQPNYCFPPDGTVTLKISEELLRQAQQFLEEVEE